MSRIGFEIRPVGQDNWNDLVLLFESRGGPSYCWCMAWCRKPAGTRQARADERNTLLKSALHAQVLQGTPIGLLAYRDGRPVGWCSIAPRATYRRLGGPDQSAAEAPIWSLVCFFVRRAFRGQGLTERLVRAAIGYARDGGARVIEAYPVDPQSPSYRFMGLVGLFEKAGFRRVGRAGTRRHVVQLDLD